MEISPFKVGGPETGTFFTQKTTLRTNVMVTLIPTNPLLAIG